MFPDCNADDMIFTAEVNGRKRRYDPLVLRRRLIRAAGGRLGKVITAAADPPEVDPRDVPSDPKELQAFEQARAAALLASVEGQDRLTAVLREAFELPSIDLENGVCEEDVCRVWAEWRAWLREKKMSGPTPPTCSPAAAGGPAPAPSSSA